MESKLKIGIVGACGRGSSFKLACDSHGGVAIHAVCDTNEEGLAGAAERLGAREKYTDYQTMLEKSDLDAVIIGTPMHFHVPQAIVALEHDLHVLSEVPAGVSIDECRDLVAACKASKGIYMMAENYTYMKQNQIVKELVRQGLFGDTYYAEGEYIHELKHMNEYDTPWRRKWQTGIEGCTYGTHSLGPILQWMPGDRVTRVCCEGTGVRHADHTGKPYVQASSTMLCKTKKEALIKKHQTIGPLTNAFGEHSAFPIAHITRRRTYQPAHSVSFLKFAHVDGDHKTLTPKKQVSHCQAHFRLAHATRTH